MEGSETWNEKKKSPWDKGKWKLKRESTANFDLFEPAFIAVEDIFTF